MTVMCVDHGEKRIGVAISDATHTLARPLVVLKHISREHDARRVVALAHEHGASLIVIGESTDEEGAPNLAGRRAGRFAAQIKGLGALAVLLWDESLSTQEARQKRLEAGASRKRRAAPIDAEAAAVILQSYLDSQKTPESPRQGE